MTFPTRFWFVLCLLFVGGCKPKVDDSSTSSRAFEDASVQKVERSAAQRLGAVYTNVPQQLKPRISRISLPEDLSGIAIWGATGRDDDGNLYFGVSTSGKDTASLWKLSPGSTQLTRAGDVDSALRRSGAYRSGERQLKIHSKVFEADDGWIYFSSMDETGEKADGSVHPKWGGHLWRLTPSNGRWEHVFQSRQALIAVAGSGRWIYALGYFDHVLYSYDTQTGTARDAVVGSVGGHISRLFMADIYGHAYVPRVTRQPDSDEYAVSLVQFSPDLTEIAATPIDHYEVTPDSESLGISAYTHLRDGRIVFATSSGHLYEITPLEKQTAKVKSLGWFHPEGKALTTGLFTFAGRQYLVGVAQRTGKAANWVTYDLQKLQSFVAESFSGIELLQEPKLNIYGTLTRDDLGNFYLVGRRRGTKGREPVILRVTVR